MKSVAAKGVATAPWPRARSGFRRPLVVLFVALAAVAGYYAYDHYVKPQPTPVAAVQTAVASRGSVVATVSGSGSVVPAQTADLAFNTSGTLVELNATVGQSVKKGDVLARLDTTDLRLAVLTAQAALATAQSNLATLEAGSTAAEVAQARATLKSAQASLDKVKAGATTSDLLAAEASVASAHSNLDKAESDLADLKAGPTETETISAKAALEKAKISLQNAQAAYDKVSWRPDVGATTEAMNLWQATADYQAAEASYETAMAPATASELAIAEQNVVSAKAQLASAEAKLADLKQGATADELASAEAAVLQAQTQLDEKLNPSTDAEKQAARAAVEQAKVAVQGAQSNLDKAVMVAPFDGVVSAVGGSVGQAVSGTVVTLLDMSAPQLQLTLTENDAAKVAVGQEASLTFDALGGQALTGKVLAISPQATVSSGIATYTATVSMEQPAQTSQGAAGGAAGQSGQAAAGSGQQAAAQATDLAKIKAGMTGSVSITYLRKDDVLTVPNKAIKTQGQNRVVEVLVDGKAETRVVTVGAADASRTEIVSGLQEGDQVVIPATATTSTSGGNRIQIGPMGGFRDVQQAPGPVPGR